MSSIAGTGPEGREGTGRPEQPEWAERAERADRPGTPGGTDGTDRTGGTDTTDRTGGTCGTGRLYDGPAGFRGVAEFPGSFDGSDASGRWETSREQAARRAREDEAQARLLRVLKGLAANRDGRDFLRWLMDECGTLRAAYPADHAGAAWDAGRRAVGCRILKLCMAAGIGGLIMEER